MNRNLFTSGRRSALLLLMLLLSLGLMGCNEQEVNSASQSASSSVPASSSASDSTAQESDRSLADFEGWWYDVDYPDETIMYIDAESGTFTETDQYGNEILDFLTPRLEEASYSDLDGCLLLEGITDYRYYYFLDDDMGTLYSDYNDEPQYIRREAPTPPNPSPDGLPGLWYRDGITEGDDLCVLEMNEDGTYRFLDGGETEKDSGTYSLTLRSDQANRGDYYDYLSITFEGELFSGDYVYAYVAEDRLMLSASYAEPNPYSHTGYVESEHVYYHEKSLSTPEGHDAVQRRALYDETWATADKRYFLFFSRNGEVYSNRHAEDLNAAGVPHWSGTWDYTAGTLNLLWDSEWEGEYAPGRFGFKDMASPVSESCVVDDVLDGLTLPSHGDFIRFVHEEIY